MAVVFDNGLEQGHDTPWIEIEPERDRVRVSGAAAHWTLRTRCSSGRIARA